MSLRVARSFAGVERQVGDPPDPTVAAGPDLLFIATNSEVALQTKDGRIVARRRLRDFVAPPNPAENVTDPRVIFDVRAARFMLVAAATAEEQCHAGDCVNHMLLAVSRTASPRSLGPDEWYRYTYDNSLEDGAPTNTWGDFHALSVTPAHLVVTGKMDSATEERNLYAKVWVFDKEPLLNGRAAVTRTYADLRDADAPAPVFTLLPAVSNDASEVVYLVSRRFDAAGSCDLVIWRMDTSALLPPQPVRVRSGGSCDLPAPLIQGPGLPAIDANDRLTQQPVARGGVVWVAESVRPTADGSAVRVTRIDVSAWPSVTARSDLIHSPTGVSYAAVGLTTHGAAVVAAEATGEGAPMMAYAALGVDGWSELKSLRRSSGSISDPQQGRPRYGDYFSASTDPTTGSVWLFGEVITTTGWLTWLAELAEQP